VYQEKESPRRRNVHARGVLGEGLTRRRDVKVKGGTKR
jgi:hypothetical protein